MAKSIRSKSKLATKSRRRAAVYEQPLNDRIERLSKKLLQPDLAAMEIDSPLPQADGEASHVKLSGRKNRRIQKTRQKGKRSNSAMKF